MRILLCALFGHNPVRFLHIYVVILCIYIHISQKNMHISGAHFLSSGHKLDKLPDFIF